MTVENVEERDRKIGNAVRDYAHAKATRAASDKALEDVRSNLNALEFALRFLNTSAEDVADRVSKMQAFPSSDAIIRMIRDHYKNVQVLAETRERLQALGLTDIE